MVLSNKKLKQKLRAAIAETLTSSIAAAATKPDSTLSNDESTAPDPNSNSNSQPQSLKQLLDSVTQKPRLSKRQKKRRKTLDSLQGAETLNRRNGGDNSKNDERVDKESNKSEEENKEDSGYKKKKKRKRNGEESKKLDLAGDDGEEEIGVVKQAKRLKKNKKKKKQKKSKAKGKNEEDNKGGDGLVGNEEQNKESDSQVNNYVTKVYVGGIPYNASENDIKTYFEGCGSITEIDYMTFPDTGKFRGIAIITFRTEGAAKRAFALDGSEMDGLFLKIQPYKTTKANKVSDFAPKIVEGYNRIYIGNLSWDITEEDLRKFLSDCKISSIRFGVDKETEEFRGYAHVDFADSLSLSMALKLDQEIVCGRPVKVSCAVPKKGIKSQSRSVPASNAATSNSTGNVASNVATSNSTDNMASNVVTSNSTDNTGLATVSGKIRRRTCYECGEKGHLSSACPKKTADPISSNTT